MTTAPQLYRKFIEESDYPHCWACGRSGDYGDRPQDWFAEWWVDRAHICNKPRVEDRRLVVLLCRLCHLGFSGQRVITASRPATWPKLTVAHLLWLKKRFDPEYYDRVFLQAHSVRELPRAVRPPYCYRSEYHGRHPL